MGGFYNSEFKCTNCNYLETLRISPKIIEPINNNIPRAKIEYRWCNNCNGIRSVFTGNGYEYSASSIYNKDQESWMGYTSVNQLTIEKEKIQLRLDFLIEDKKNIKLNFFQNFFQNHFTKKIDTYINATKSNIVEINIKINKFKKSIETSLVLNENARVFYNSKNSIPKCLCCGNIDVSLLSFENENHICGGKIIEKKLGRGGSTDRYIKLNYDQFGNSTAALYTHDYINEEQLIQKLEKPYHI